MSDIEQSTKHVSIFLDILWFPVDLLIKTTFNLFDIHGSVRRQVIKSRSLVYLEMLKWRIGDLNTTIFEFFYRKTFPETL